ncbi:DciA family protein [Steroidobacter denitrificans]|nr:DciA family protein [Steroidobacter denitrificans]
MSDHLKPLSAGLGPLFESLERRSLTVLDLTARVRKSLEGPEKNHIISASYRGETLIVATDSAAWCPYIRYAQDILLARLNQTGETRFTKIKVKVGRKDPSLRDG